MIRSVAVLLAGVLGLSAPALAQEVYWGGGLSYASGTSDNVTGGAGSSDLSAGMLSLIIGQRFDRGSVFFGWEANADLSFGAETENTTFGTACSAGAQGSYLCEHDTTLRLVGILGASVRQGTDVFGSLGVGMLKGDFATSEDTVESASVKGLTLGVGVSHAFGNGLIGRGEVIHDRFDQSSQTFYDSDYSGTTVRFALIRRF